jgi:hypothetical protein
MHMKLRILTIAATIFIFFGASPFAQENDVSRVYVQIDKAFSDESTDALGAVLKANAGSRSYVLYESYTLKKTRQLIIEDNLEFARAVSLVVIDNNLENFDAVNLYSYIDKAILNEQAAKQAEENKRLLEAARAAAANERTKEQLKGSFQELKTASGKAVYISEQQESYSPLSWTVSLGIADVVYQKVTEPDYASTKYGIAFDADLFYTVEKYVLGADLFADVQMLTMGSGEQEAFTTIRFIPQLAFTSLNKKLFFRMGFASYGLISTSSVATGSQESFISPVMGIALDNISFGKNTFGVHYDYCLGHLAYDNLKTAMEFGMQTFMPLTVSERSKVGLKVGVSDLLFVKTEGIESRAKVLFAIGVGNVAE